MRLLCTRRKVFGNDCMEGSKASIRFIKSESCGGGGDGGVAENNDGSGSVGYLKAERGATC